MGFGKIEKTIEGYYVVKNIQVTESNMFRTVRELEESVENELIKAVTTIKEARDRGRDLRDLLDNAKIMKENEIPNV